MERDSMDRLDAMSTFLAVVEAGSLSAAARQLKMPQTTISRNISELEPYLRTKLFNRSSRQLVLTDAGSSYLAACKRILTDVTEAERTASGEYTAPTGELSVITPLGLGRTILIPIVADFLKAYPEMLRTPEDLVGHDCINCIGLPRTCRRSSSTRSTAVTSRLKTTVQRSHH